MRSPKPTAPNRAAPRTCLVVLAVSMLVLAAAPASGTAGARQLWLARYNDRNDAGDYLNAMAVSPDGSTVFVTGHDNRKWITVAYDARTGARRWTAKYHAVQSGANEADGLAVSPDGSTVFVTGGSRSRATGWDAVTVAYSASTGEQLWEARSTGGPGKAYASAGDPRVSPDGSALYVTAGRVFAYAAATGRRLWVSQSAGGLLAVSPDGSRVFATRSRQRGRGEDLFTNALDTRTGDRVWTRSYRGPEAAGADVPGGIGVSHDGSEVFVTGTSDGDYLTIAYGASDGVTLWVRRYDGPAQSGGNARAIAVSPAGSSVFVTGNSGAPTTGEDFATVAYDTHTGSKLWVRRFAGPGDSYDGAEAVTTSPSGSTVYVTGISNGDYLTLAYDASTGAPIWRKRYNGPGNDFDVAVGIAASPDASLVFVTGSSTGVDTRADYATIAYRA